MELTFSLDKTQIQTRLMKVAGGIRDLSQPLEGIGDHLLQYYSTDVFNAQGVAGDTWNALSESTQKMRAKHWGYYKNSPVQTGMILVWTGHLRSGFYKIVEPMKLMISNNVEYFKYHQQSQRKMLALTGDVVTYVSQSLQKYLAYLLTV